MIRINKSSSTEWSRCIGIRNSHDRTIAVGLSAGISVHVCSNLCFGGSTVLKRRHTSRIELNGLVLEAVNALELEFLTYTPSEPHGEYTPSEPHGEGGIVGDFFEGK